MGWIRYNAAVLSRASHNAWRLVIAHSWQQLVGKIATTAVLIVLAVFYTRSTPQEDASLVSDEVQIIVLAAAASMILVLGVFLIQLLFVAPFQLWREARDSSPPCTPARAASQPVEPEAAVLWLLRTRKTLEEGIREKGFDRLVPIPEDGGSVAKDAAEQTNRSIMRDRADWFAGANIFMRLINEVLKSDHNIKDYSGMSDSARNGSLDKDDTFTHAGAKAEHLKALYSRNRLDQLRKEAIARIYLILSHRTLAVSYKQVLDALERDEKSEA